eukprot:UN04046
MVYSTSQSALLVSSSSGRAAEDSEIVDAKTSLRSIGAKNSSVSDSPPTIPVPKSIVWQTMIRSVTANSRISFFFILSRLHNIILGRKGPRRSTGDPPSG